MGSTTEIKIKHSKNGQLKPPTFLHRHQMLASVMSVVLQILQPRKESQEMKAKGFFKLSFNAWTTKQAASLTTTLRCAVFPFE